MMVVWLRAEGFSSLFKSSGNSDAADGGLAESLVESWIALGEIELGVGSSVTMFATGETIGREVLITLPVGGKVGAFDGDGNALG